jgi:uncharacterized repeat protein (TIGR01451 family)
MAKIRVVAVALVAWAIATPAPPAAADAKQPLLSIAVDNGRTAVAAGDRLTYTVKIQNIGATGARRLEVSQSMPPGLTFVSADRGGVARAGRVIWRIDLRAGQESALTTVARVGKTPRELLRLATVACATAKGDRKPRVCATHSDVLPAGTGPARAGQPESHRGYGLAVAALVVVGLAGILVARRRIRHRTAPAPGRAAGHPMVDPPAATDDSMPATTSGDGARLRT